MFSNAGNGQDVNSFSPSNGGNVIRSVLENLAVCNYSLNKPHISTSKNLIKEKLRTQ